MIVVDTSALVAIGFAEPEREAFLQTIKTAGKALVNTVSVVEIRMVVHGRRGQRAVSWWTICCGCRCSSWLRRGS
jgi:ribonuclease VapC